jgi:hypothetical protein
MSQALVLIQRLKDLCGKSFQKFQLKEKRVQLLSQPIQWRKLKLSAQRWALWLLEDSNALALPSILKPNLEL